MQFNVSVSKIYLIAALEKLERRIIKFRPLELEKLRLGEIRHVNKVSERFMRVTKPFDIRFEFAENSLRISTFFYSTTIPATGKADTYITLAGQPMMMIYRTFSNRDTLQFSLIENIPEATEKYLCKIDTLRFQCKIAPLYISTEPKYDESFLLCSP